jgi:hypothetical protein
MPRNGDVMAICDAYEAMQAAARTAIDHAALASRPAFSADKANGKPAKSRAAYMRDYRKKERAIIQEARKAK